MSPTDDYYDDMGSLDDETVEDVVTGRSPAAGDLTELARLREEMRACFTGRAPVPNAELLSVLERGLLPTRDSVEAVPAGASPSRRRPPSRPRVAAKVAAGVVFATAGITTAAAAGVLPGNLERTVARVVEKLTPFTLGVPGSAGGRQLPVPAERWHPPYPSELSVPGPAPLGSEATGAEPAVQGDTASNGESPAGAGPDEPPSAPPPDVPDVAAPPPEHGPRPAPDRGFGAPPPRRGLPDEDRPRPGQELRGALRQTARTVLEDDQRQELRQTVRETRDLIR